MTAWHILGAFSLMLGGLGLALFWWGVAGYLKHPAPRISTPRDDVQ